MSNNKRAGRDEGASKLKSSRITRRKFLAVSSASIITISADKADANIGAAFFRPQSRETAVKAVDSQRPWYAVMRRCGQINFNERDPLTMDVNEWADYWASLKVNAVLINGGGIVAFYPTEVPYHHRSQFLGSRDLFGEMAAALAKRHLRVVARMDCNYAYEEAFGEKLRALGERTRPRDLYDVVNLYRHTDTRPTAAVLLDVPS